MPTADEDPKVETVQERAARGEPDAVRRMAILAQLEDAGATDLARVAAGLPPLPRRTPERELARLGERIVDVRHTETLADAVEALRNLAHDAEDPHLTFEFPEHGDDDTIGRNDLRRWADAIEALLR